MKFFSHHSTTISGGCSRRSFLIAAGGAALGSSFFANMAGGAEERRVRPAGPASKYVPAIRATLVRREGEFGMRWPGAIYDGKKALSTYRRRIEETAKELGMKLAMRPAPIYSEAEEEH